MSNPMHTATLRDAIRDLPPDDPGPPCGSNGLMGAHRD